MKALIKHHQIYLLEIFSLISTIGFMVFNATFNNISVISWQSFLLVEETGIPVENHRPAAGHTQAFHRHNYR
jgi:hypothetical protein